MANETAATGPIGRKRPRTSRQHRDLTVMNSSGLGSGVMLDAPGWPPLLDQISDVIFTTDAGALITHWSTSAELLFGYSASDAAGHALGELLGFRVAQPGGRELRSAVREGRTWRGAASVRHRDGREVWLDATVDPILVDGRPSGSVYLCRDTTEIHRGQVSLAGEERFFSSVLDVVGALVLILDGRGRITRFNSACERLSGFDSADVVGRSVWDVVIPPAEVDDVRATLAALQAGTFPNSHENHWLTRSGEMRLISWQNTCLTDDRGLVTHVIATGTDITEARRRHDAMRGLETVGHLMAEQGPTPAALDLVLGEMQARMGYGFLSLYVDDGVGLRLAAQRGYRAMPERLETGQGLIGRVYGSGHAEFAPDRTGDLNSNPGGHNLTSEIAVPLLGGGATLGVLSIGSVRPETMTENDMQFARTVADRIVSALRRSRAHEALLSRTSLFTALAEFAAAVNAIREPERLVAALVDAVGAVVPSDTVVVTMLDHNDGLYHVAAVRGLAQAAVGVVVQPGDGTAGRSISERKVIISDRHRRTESTAALRDFLPYEMIRTVVVPLIRDDTVLGVISVGRADTDATFTAAELEVFTLLGSHAALALTNAHLIAEVSALAIRDGLTGLYNRRHFDAELELAIARFRRHAPDGKLAAIMFDLDHFGEFNRRHGHLAGDALLRLFGQVLRERLRSADIVARYGGEEFVAILEDCGLAEATRLADDVRRDLEARSVSGPDGQALRATVSAGCSVAAADEPTTEALLGQADAGLFKAKASGRNCVVAS